MSEKSKYDYDTIRDYLHGLVDKDTARQVSDLIKQDDVARSIAVGIIEMERDFNGDDESIEKYLETFRQAQLVKIKTSATNPGQSTSTWLRLAAGFLLLMGVGSAIYFATRNDLSSAVDEMLEQPYAVLTVTRGPGELSPLQKGFELYARGKFDQALPYFEQEMNGNDQASATFYAGLSKLYVEQYNDAVQLLSSDAVLKSRYSIQAEWYQSLGYIKSASPAKAKDILTKLASDVNGFRQKEAAQLLELMN